MRFEYCGETVFASTGGRDPVPGQPWIIFVHGAGQSHLTWSQQVRALAYDNYNILAPDLPGHGASSGISLENIADMADWILGVMDTLSIGKAHLVNHSMGGLICLELAANHAEQVLSISFIATGLSIAVSPALIDMAKKDQRKAIDFMTDYSSSSYAHTHDNSVPGASLIGGGIRIMEHNDKTSLPRDLQACADYKNGADAAARIECPTLCLLAKKDKMVQSRFGLKLAGALKNNQTIMFEDAGHSLPLERPREINKALRNFLKVD